MKMKNGNAIESAGKLIIWFYIEYISTIYRFKNQNSVLVLQSFQYFSIFYKRCLA